MLTTPNRRIGDVLRQCGMVTEEQLDQAHALASREGVRIGEALVLMGVLDRDRLTWALGVQFDLSYVDLDMEMIDWAFVRRFRLARLRELRLLPMSFAGGVVHAVVADPTRAQLDVVAEELFPGRELVVQLAEEGEILAMLDEAKRQEQTPRDAFAPMPGTDDAAAWLAACIDTLGGGDARNSLVVLQQDPYRQDRFRVVRPAIDPPAAPIGEALIGAIIELIPSRFTEEFPLPGGFAGLCPEMLDEEGGIQRGAVRVTSLHGTAGRTIIIERVPDAPREARAMLGVVLRTADTVRSKASLARLRGVFFEAHSDFLLCRGARQFSSPDPALRAAICRRVARALAAPWIVWEALTPAEADLAPLGIVDRLVVVRHDPHAAGDLLEPHGECPAATLDELAAALGEDSHVR